MKKIIRTRFAPSPTGYLHLGSLRTALFNWLWAKKNKGEFLLRLEDTDQSRLIDDAQIRLLTDLKNAGLNWDFGPDKPHPKFGSLIQSQRLDVYQKFIKELLGKKIAYYDYTTPLELENLRKKSQSEKKAFIFRKKIAQLKPTTQNKDKPVIRIAISDDIKIDWIDVVKGQQSWQGQDIGDFIAVKSDGWPTYHFANVVDDYLMQISHVIRADEWLSSTPKHLYLFDCFNWERPSYVHVPPVLSTSGGQKLSKREQSSQVSYLWEKGYLNSAVLNYLSLLGWNPKNNQEIFNLNDLMNNFDIHNIQVSGARFDPVRLDWFNGQHLRSLPEREREIQAEKWWPNKAQNFDKNYKNKVLQSVYQRLKNWSQLTEMTHFFFTDPQKISDEKLIAKTKFENQQIQNLLKKTLSILKESDFSLGDLELKLYQFAQEHKISPNKYFTLLRLKLTGQEIAPGLFVIINILGLKECQKRLQSDN